MPDQEPQELNPEEQMVFKNDLKDLQQAEEEHGMGGKLEGRVKFGLDPAGMMVVRDTAPLAAKIAAELGTTEAQVWPLIKELHEKGPWELADRLKAAEDPEIRTYLVLAASCQEANWPGYAPKAYLEDRNRVVKELGSFTSDKFAERRKAIASRVEIEKIEADGAVPVIEGDAALLLAVQGYKGCVAKTGEMRFAQTSNIEDKLLEENGLVKGFVEINSEKTGYERVSLEDPRAAKGRTVWIDSKEATKGLSEMDPVAKRIGPGYVLTYKNENLAIQLVASALEVEKSV